MKFYIVLLFLNLTALCGVSQYAEYSDSKIKLMLDSAGNLLATNPSMAIEIIDEIKPSIIALDLDFELAAGTRVQGGANLYLGNNKAALSFYEKAFEIDSRISNSKGVIKDYRGIALCYGELREFEKNTEFLKKALTIAQESKEESQVIDIKESMGVAFFYQKQYLNAVEAYTEAIQLSKKLGDSSKLISIYINLGAVYADIEKLDLAINVLLEGSDLASKSDNVIAEAIFFSTIAGVYYKQNNYDSAIEYYEKSIELFQKNQFNKGVAYSKMGLAMLYEDTKQMDEAIINVEEAYTYANAIEDYVILAYYHALYTRIKFEDDNYLGALIQSDSALVYVRKSKDLVIEQTVLELRYMTFEKLNQSDSALYYFKYYTVIKDSINNADNISKIENIELSRVLENKKNESEIRKQKLALSQEKERSTKIQLYLVVLLSIIILMLLLGFFFYRMKKLKHEKELIEKKKSLEQAKQKLDSLKLEKEISHKNNRIKELAFTINKKNDLLLEFSNEAVFNDNKVLLKKFNRLIDSAEERSFFNEEIAQASFEFQRQLKALYPNVTENDLKLASMLKIGLSSKEMAALLSISSSSVDVARSRLRKKLNLSKGNNLLDFLNEL